MEAKQGLRIQQQTLPGMAQNHLCLADSDSEALRNLYKKKEVSWIPQVCEIMTFWAVSNVFRPSFHVLLGSGLARGRQAVVAVGHEEIILQQPRN